MKNIIAFISFCFLAITASAQLNTDTAQATRRRISSYDEKANKAQDHLHPKFQNIANPTGPGYEGDGAVFRSEAIINRHITNINDLIR